MSILILLKTNITNEDVENTLIKWYTNVFVGETDTILYELKATIS